MHLWRRVLTLSHSLRGSIVPTWNGTGADHRDPNLEVLVERPDTIDACMLLLRKMTNHFSVTCPFWTRFMLKPTVGIELRGVVSKRIPMQHCHGWYYSIVNSPP